MCNYTTVLSLRRRVKPLLARRRGRAVQTGMLGRIETDRSDRGPAEEPTYDGSRRRTGSTYEYIPEVSISVIHIRLNEYEFSVYGSTSTTSNNVTKGYYRRQCAPCLSASGLVSLECSLPGMLRVIPLIRVVGRSGSGVELRTLD